MESWIQAPAPLNRRMDLFQTDAANHAAKGSGRTQLPMIEVDAAVQARDTGFLERPP